MKIQVNGETLEVRSTTLAELLGELGYSGDSLATAVNGGFVARGQRASTALAAGMDVEIVTPMQGG